MADQLLKLALLLLLVSYASSMDTTMSSVLVETNWDPADSVVPKKVIDPTINSALEETNSDPTNLVVPKTVKDPTNNSSFVETNSDQKNSVVPKIGMDPTVSSTLKESNSDPTNLVAPTLVMDKTNNSTLVDTDNVDFLPDLTPKAPLLAALNHDVSSDKVPTLVDATTEELMTSLASTKESKVIPEQEASPTEATSQGETSTSKTDVVTMVSTTSEDPSPVPFTLRPVNDRFTFPSDFTTTGQEGDKASDNEVTFSHPSSTTTRIPKTVSTKAPNMEPTTTKKPEASLSKGRNQVILITTVIVILILILITAVVALVRCKRRRGSQSFRSQSKSSKRADVWAGQVPELGDGKMTPHPMAMENGTSHKAEPGNEQEMTTFTSGEKKDDSLIELNELQKEDDSENKPLLEESSEMNEEPEKPPEEQITAPTMEQELL